MASMDVILVDEAGEYVATVTLPDALNQPAVIEYDGANYVHGYWGALGRTDPTAIRYIRATVWAPTEADARVEEPVGRPSASDDEPDVETDPGPAHGGRGPRGRAHGVVGFPGRGRPRG